MSTLSQLMMAKLDVLETVYTQSPPLRTGTPARAARAASELQAGRMPPFLRLEMPTCCNKNLSRRLDQQSRPTIGCFRVSDWRAVALCGGCNHAQVLFPCLMSFKRSQHCPSAH